MKHPIKIGQRHTPIVVYERDDLRDVKINRTTRTRITAIKSKFGYKNLDELLNPALDLLEKQKAGNK